MTGTRRAVAVVLLCACGSVPDSGADPDGGSDATVADSGFAALQERGAGAMGVDQYTSTHRFEPLPDGGRIELQRDLPDSLGRARILAHLAAIARAFGSGDFTVPGSVHARDVPGTDVMAAKRASIRYVVESLPRGGALRLQTADSSAVRAIHRFLAFQRMDHRAGPHHGK